MDAILECENQFVDFGRDWLMPYQRDDACRIRAANRHSLRAAVRSELPQSPGIYGFVNGEGKLVYVGKSKALRSRVLSYFLPNNQDEKAGQIASVATEILWETQPTEFAALLREQKLISRWQPRFNVVGMPRRQRTAYLCVGRGPAECFYLSSKPDKKARASEGPFHGLTRLRRVVEVLNHIMRLRDCNDKTKFDFRDQLTLFDDPRRAGCLRAELQTCLGPCAAFCTRGEYDRQIAAAVEFLKGNNVKLVDELEAAMLRAAGRLQFELAARLREDWQMVQWITRKLFDNEQARSQYNFIYPLKGCDGRDIWYLIRAGKVEHAIARPTSRVAWRQARAEILSWAAATSCLEGMYDGGANTLHIVAAWFRKNRDDLKMVKSIAQLPDESQFETI